MKKNSALPPQELRFMGESDTQFLEIGDLCIKMIEHTAALPSIGSILDIGCGYGRLAHALWRNEMFTGDYYGLDILPKHIKFCQQELSPLGKYHFLHLDVHNGRYNPKGKFTVSQLDFYHMPRVDIITLFSVFTHLYSEDIKSYIQHARKILNPHGKLIFTAFILENPSSKNETMNAQYPMHIKLDENCYYHSHKDPLHAISYSKNYIHKILSDAGFCNIQFLYGNWSPSKYIPTNINPIQDLCIAELCE